MTVVIRVFALGLVSSATAISTVHAAPVQDPGLLVVHNFQVRPATLGPNCTSVAAQPLRRGGVLVSGRVETIQAEATYSLESRVAGTRRWRELREIVLDHSTAVRSKVLGKFTAKFSVVLYRDGRLCPRKSTELRVVGSAYGRTWASRSVLLRVVKR